MQLSGTPQPATAKRPWACCTGCARQLPLGDLAPDDEGSFACECSELLGKGDLTVVIRDSDGCPVFASAAAHPMRPSAPAGYRDGGLRAGPRHAALGFRQETSSTAWFVIALLCIGSLVGAVIVLHGHAAMLVIAVGLGLLGTIVFALGVAALRQRAMVTISAGCVHVRYQQRPFSPRELELSCDDIRQVRCQRYLEAVGGRSTWLHRVVVEQSDELVTIATSQTVSEALALAAGLREALGLEPGPTQRTIEVATPSAKRGAKPGAARASRPRPRKRTAAS